jgi:hypothetical protein
MIVHRVEVAATAKRLGIETINECWALIEPQPVCGIENSARCAKRGSSMGTFPRYITVQVLTLLVFLFAGRSNTIGHAAQQAASDFKVTLLGTSTPNPLPDRFGPSTLVEAGNEKLLFDLRPRRHNSSVAAQNSARNSQALHHALALRSHRRHP